jgi:hypothetical protein
MPCLDLVCIGWELDRVGSKGGMRGAGGLWMLWSAEACAGMLASAEACAGWVWMMSTGDVCSGKWSLAAGWISGVFIEAVEGSMRDWEGKSWSKAIGPVELGQGLQDKEVHVCVERRCVNQDSEE